MAWGDDEKGQLGVEESHSEEELCYGETHAITPVQCSTVPRAVKVSGLGVLTGVERIGAGEEAAYAVRGGGREVLAWGGGGKGQLGNGEDDESASPVKASFEPSSPVVEIAGGSQHVLALLGNGEVYAWGADGSGQLGFETGSEASESCGRQKCSMVPEAVGELDHVVAVAAGGEGVSFALKEEENATKVIYSFGAGGFFELLGLGNQSFTTTSTPTPIEGIASVRGVSASGTTAVALLQSGSPAAPRMALSASEEALTLTWKVQTEPYKLRYVPVGTREFSKTQESTCKGECTRETHGSETGALRGDPEKPRRTRRKRTDEAHHRHAGGAEIVARERLAAHHQRQPPHRNRETAPRPDADRLAGHLVGEPHPVHLPVAPLRGQRRSRRQRRTGDRM